MGNVQIPLNLIGILGEAFDRHYTHAKIERLFTYADAPDMNPGGNKVIKTMEWLRLINKNHGSPLIVLGKLIEDLMERETWPEATHPMGDPGNPNSLAQLQIDRQKVSDSQLGRDYHINQAASSRKPALFHQRHCGTLSALKVFVLSNKR